MGDLFYNHLAEALCLPFIAKEHWGVNLRLSGVFFAEIPVVIFLEIVPADVLLSGGRAPVVRVAVGWLRVVPFGYICWLVGQLQWKFPVFTKQDKQAPTQKRIGCFVEFWLQKITKSKQSNNIGRQLLFGFISLFLVYPE